MLRLVKTFALAACVAALAAPAMAQTKWNLPAAYPADNPHSVNLIAFAKDVGDATGGKFFKAPSEADLNDAFLAISTLTQIRLSR